MIKYGGNPYNPNKKRSTERIAGGLGDRQPAPKKLEGVIDPSTTETVEDRLIAEEDASNVIDMHSEDRLASIEMAEADMNIPRVDDDPDYDPSTGPTQYDQHMKDGNDPESPAFHNGRIAINPSLAEPTEAAKIAEESFSQKDARIRRTPWRVLDETYFSRWFKRDKHHESNSRQKPKGSDSIRKGPDAIQ